MKEKHCINGIDGKRCLNVVPRLGMMCHACRSRLLSAPRSQDKRLLKIADEITKAIAR